MKIFIFDQVTYRCWIANTKFKMRFAIDEQKRNNNTIYADGNEWIFEDESDIFHHLHSNLKLFT